MIIGGVDDAGAHLLRGADHDVERRARIAERAVLAQPAEDVLDVDDRVIDQFADGDRDAAERHGVDRQSGEIEHHRGGRIETGIAVSEIAVVRQFSRNANSTIATTTPASSSTVCTLRIDVSMKLACRKIRLVGLDAVRQVAVQLLQRVLDLARQRDGVDIRLLLDRDHDGGLAHVAAVAALDAGRELDRRDLVQEDRPAVDLGDHDVAQIVEAGGAADVADQIFARVEIGEAAAGVGAELRPAPSRSARR